MPLYDFKCEGCGETTEEVVPYDVKSLDCGCGAKKKRLACAANTLTNIVPSYPGSLRQKAGYVHTHGDRPATKIMSGPAGCTSPQD
jgi:putative FmdB family regulatory protein